MIAVADQVMPRNALPLYAATPISLPNLLISLTALTMMTVEIMEAIARVRNASCPLLEFWAVKER